jgi:hypothetical protein
MVGRDSDRTGASVKTSGAAVKAARLEREGQTNKALADALIVL